MLTTIDYYARHAVAFPLVLFGWALTNLATAFIRVGAWIADIDVSDIDVECDEDEDA